MNFSARAITGPSLVLFVLSSCAPTAPLAPLPQSQWRPITAMPTQVYADTIPVVKFRAVCDSLARSLITQPFIARAASPPVITIRKLENKTGLALDQTIYQETIRVRLMEHAGGMVLFRDDVSYKDIIKERVRQSGEEVTVTLTDSVVETKTYDRVKEREYDSGSLSGLGGSQEQAVNVEDESSMEMDQSATVKGGLADADYFLRGIIYQIKEEDSTQPGFGMNYFQFQFRLTDARSGLIVWEKMLDSKLAGEYTPVVAPPPAQGTAGQPANIPAGWGQPGVPAQAAWPPQVMPGQPAQGQAQVPQGWNQGQQQGSNQQQNVPNWP